MVEINLRQNTLSQLRQRTPKSLKLWQESQEIVLGGLFSLARMFEPYPFYTARGKGAYLWDVDENRYIDCCMAYGVLLLGHAPEVVQDALRKQIERGTVYTTPHSLEIEYARRLVECIPCAETVLMTNSGTEATMQAIRIMRASTGRDKIAKFEGCYHGWHDYAMWSTDMDEETAGPAKQPHANAASGGIPAAVRNTMLVLPFEDSAFDLIEKHAHELAGVIIEPVIGGGALPVEAEFLQKLRDVTAKNQLLLMYDEVVTGFRISLGGMQEATGVLPDLATYGKVIGGGTPVGAVACSEGLMRTVTESKPPLMIAGTFNGNPLTLSAGNALLKYLMENPHVYDELAIKGEHLRNSFNDWAQEKGYSASMTGLGSLFQAHLKSGPLSRPRDLFGQPKEALHDLQLQLRLNGVFTPWNHMAFLSTAHLDEDVDSVLLAHQRAVESSLVANGV
jgi:glutamate-1-semialdehyde 2,1-aminomutase